VLIYEFGTPLFQERHVGLTGHFFPSNSASQSVSDAFLQQILSKLFIWQKVPLKPPESVEPNKSSPAS
jgi:hypothetical protein